MPATFRPSLSLTGQEEHPSTQTG